METVGPEPITVLAKFCDAQVKNYDNDLLLITAQVKIASARPRDVGALRDVQLHNFGLNVRRGCSFPVHCGIFTLTAGYTVNPKLCNLTKLQLTERYCEGATKHGGELRGALPWPLCCRSVESVESLQRCKIIVISSFPCSRYY